MMPSWVLITMSGPEYTKRIQQTKWTKEWKKWITKALKTNECELATTRKKKDEKATFNHSEKNQTVATIYEYASNEIEDDEHYLAAFIKWEPTCKSQHAESEKAQKKIKLNKIK